MGILKGKSSLMIFDQFANLKYKYGNRHFWCRGYYVDTVTYSYGQFSGIYLRIEYKKNINFNFMLSKLVLFKVLQPSILYRGHL